MAYSLVNAITFLIGLVFLLNGYYLIRSGREDLTLFFISGAIGIGLLAVAVYPKFFQVVASLLGLELKARAILVAANLTLFVVVVLLLQRMKGLYERTSRLNEELSLLRHRVEERDE